MDDLEIIDVSDIDDVDVLSNENEYNIVEDIFVDDEVYVSDTISEDLPDLIEAGQFYIYLPVASVFSKGIAKFNSNHFTVIDGLVYAKLTPKAISDELGNNIIDTYQRKDNMIEQWISEIRQGTYPSAKLVKDSLDNIIYNKGKGVFVFTTQEDFLNWIDGKLETDINGKIINDLVVGDDIFMLDGSINYWCKKLSDPLTIDDFMSYAKSIWGSITGNIQEQADLIELLNNIVNKIPDVSKFITKAVSDLENYYTKSQTYTQDEIKNLVSTIPKFKIEVVTSLPTENISTTTVYLLKTSETETSNLYTEYIYVNGIWEKLGTQKLDLSNYPTIGDMNVAINTALANYYTKTEIDDLISEIQQDIDTTLGNVAELHADFLKRNEDVDNKISSIEGDISGLNQDVGRALKTPISAPSSTQIVGVNSANSQVMIEIDTAFSTESENPVQNKVIAAELNKKLSNERVVLYAQNNTTFSAQKISFDTTPYNYFQLLFRIVGGEEKFISKFIPKDYLTQGVMYMFWDTIFKREFTMSATGITFTDGYQITGYNTSGPITNNNVMIPFYIYGIK